MAEIRYGKVQEQEQLITDLTKQIEESGEKRLLKEEVDAEDIAESIAKATGIPVTKMLQSDKEKLLKVVFTGNGNGHGVGFCQWGAMDLSKKGEKFRNILNLYLPHTQITKAYD